MTSWGMEPLLEKKMLLALKAKAFKDPQTIQSLWNGYGKIVRLGLVGGERSSIVIKRIRPEKRGAHKRGWDQDFGHERKLKSYEVEACFYKDYQSMLKEPSSTAQCIGVLKTEKETLLLLEDLTEKGYPLVLETVTLEQLEAVLKWLAYFHATFLGVSPKGLWQTGTYWHLETRPDELKALLDLPLKKAAPFLDEALKSSPYQTLVHGDAKVANFCFSPSGDRVCGVDFQYVGGGPGIKDVAYFVSSVFNSEQSKAYESHVLDVYFSHFKKAAMDKKLLHINIEKLEENWRELYPIAWADFYRFLKGWCKDHKKINDYSSKIARKVCEKFNF